MDQPLFGEQRQGAAALQGIIGFIVMAFTTVTIICGVIKGIHDAKLFALVISVAFVFVNLVILTVWYRNKEDRLHPKFKYLMITFIVAMIVLCSSSMVFIWYKAPGIPTNAYPVCDGLMQQMGMAGQKNYSAPCYTISNSEEPLQTCLDMTPDYCIIVTSTNTISCLNCTAYYAPPPPTTSPQLEEDLCIPKLLLLLSLLF